MKIITNDGAGLQIPGDPLENLRATLRAYDPVKGICFLTAYQHEMDDDKAVYQAGYKLLHGQSLLFLAKELLSVHHPLVSSLSNLKDMDKHDLHTLLNMRNGIVDGVSLIKDEDFGGYSRSLAVFFRTISNQYMNPIGLIRCLTRAWSIFVDTPPYVSLDRLKIDIFKEYQELNGFGIKEAIALGFSVSALLLGKGRRWFHIEQFQVGKMIEGKEWLNRFVSRFSVRIEDFASAQENMDKRWKCTAPISGPNYLWLRPLVVLPDNRIVCPNLDLLGMAIADSVYWDLFDIFIERSKSATNAFTGSYGHIFEQYIGRLLSGRFTSILSEHQLKQRAEDSAPDWVIVHDGIAIVLECKSRRPKIKTKFTGDETSLKEDTEAIYSATVQLGTFVSNFGQGKYSHLPLLRDVRTIVPVVVTQEPFHGCHSNLSRSVIRQWHEKSHESSNYSVRDYILLSAFDVEELVREINEQSAVEALLRHFEIVLNDEGEFSFAVDSLYMHLLTRGGEMIRVNHPMHVSALRNMAETAKRLFFS